MGFGVQELGFRVWGLGDMVQGCGFWVLEKGCRGGTGVNTDLTQCIYYLVLRSQLSHKIVNFAFQLVIVNNQLTILWGS